MKKEDDFPRLEGGERIDIDFENLCVRKRRWNPFFFVALIFLLAAIVFAVVKLVFDNQDGEAVAALEEEVDWQGAFVDEPTFLRCKMASVSVRANGKACSGVVLSEDGWIATVSSVVNDSVRGRVEVALFDGRVFEVDCFRESRRAGLVLMKIDAQGLCAADTAFDGRISAGEEIYTFCALGNASNLSLFSGRISQTNTRVEIAKEFEKKKVFLLMQIGILLTEEGDGAPLFNSQGELVGIGCGFFGNSVDSQKYMINYAFSFEKIRPLLSKMKSGGYYGDEFYGFICE